MTAAEIKKLEDENRALKEQIEALSFQRDKYKKLFDVSADALSILDLDTGKFIECNQSAISMHGVESEENFLNLTPSQISPEFQPCGNTSESMAIGYISRTFTEGPQLFQWVHSKLDGSTFPCLVSLTALPVDNKKLILAIGRDISEIIEAQDKLTKANDAKSTFLANMSHELRTPMTTVLGYTDLILDDCNLENSIRENCERIKYATSSLLGIINEILDMSKLESGKLELEYSDFDFPAFVSDISSMFKGKRIDDKAIEWQLSIDEEIPQGIRSDSTRLKQVLFNLIGNALKFTEKGKISIHCKRTTNYVGAPYIEVSVQDTGVGFNNNLLDKIFDPFIQADSTTSRKFSGTGLGLPISKRIIELLGGEIHGNGSEGEGAKFWFTFPLLEAEAELQNIKQLPSAANYTATRQLNILLVEDNRINQLLASKIIASLGHHVDVAENGQQAIDAHISNDYDLILMDIRMPVMDGIEATRNIRAEGSNKADIPIIALTADMMKESVSAYLEAGMNASSSKPFNWPQLLITINQVLAEDIHVQRDAA